jgi:LCP family protein required for cell wall assembly
VRVLGWIGAFLGIAVLAGGGFGMYQYQKLSGNIRRDANALATNDAAIRDAARQLDAENYLLIGSDTRAGANGRYEENSGQVSGERSDTTILAHLSPDRSKATMISFPRDSWVRLPACRKRDGGQVPERFGQFNEAFATGGPQCAVLAVQKLTGIRINHYVQVDFTGFKTMVDAVDGVPMCSTTRLRDSESGLELDPGTSLLRGEQALAYVRARYGIGDGSDLGRIQRQQRFLGAMVRKATSAKLLANPVALTRFLDATTKSLTLDEETSLGDLKALADQLRDLDPNKVGFLTAPIADPAYNPPGFPPPPPGRGGSKVLLDDVAGRKLWDSIINDKPAPPKTAPKTSGPPKPTVLTVLPENVTVKVLNGVGLDGLARKVAGELQSAGFKTVQPTNAPRTAATTVRYPPAQVAAARTVAAAVPGAVLQPSADVGAAIELVVGSNYSSVVTVQVGDPATARTVAAPKPSRSPTSGPKPSPAINAADASCT